jgi:hypothetical protein
MSSKMRWSTLIGNGDRRVKNWALIRGGLAQLDCVGQALKGLRLEQLAARRSVHGRHQG